MDITKLFVCKNVIIERSTEKMVEFYEELQRAFREEEKIIKKQILRIANDLRIGNTFYYKERRVDIEFISQ